MRFRAQRHDPIKMMNVNVHKNTEETRQDFSAN
jgi:hypothetical protein